MRGCGIRAESAEGSDVTLYRERLSPSLWVLVAAAVCGPMAALVLTPLHTTIGLLVGAVVAVGIVVVLVLTAPRLEVVDGELRAGPARIDVRYLGDPAVTVGEEARAARGPLLDPRSWMLIRGGIDGIVTVPVNDPDDPAPSWVLSTRTPDRLAAAIRRAQLTQRTPST